MTAHESHDVTETELALLDVLWERGRPCSIRQLTDALYPGGGSAQYATVQKLLDRLEAKGFVARDRSAFVHVFWATVGREELIGRRLRTMADKLCGGSLVPLLTHLVRTAPLTAAERQSLRDLIGRPGVAGGPQGDGGEGTPGSAPPASPKRTRGRKG
jgi:BlaI family transcriptional regulator, penicillinase repressor